MTTEIQPPFTSEDLRKDFDRLRSDLNVVQNELDQALSVWRSILETEKQEFKKLIEDREKGWDRDQAQWEKDRLAYEQKIKDIESQFNQHLRSTEQNAIKALDELDSAWQQERQKWQNVVSQQAKDFRQKEELFNAANRQLEQRIAQMTDEQAKLQARVDEVASLEFQLNEWRAEKSAWQQSLSDRVNELRQSEQRWLEERQQKTVEIQRLREDLAQSERRAQDAERGQKSQKLELESYTDSLEKQVTMLQELLQQLLLPSHPLRRRSDAMFVPPARPVATLPRTH